MRICCTHSELSTAPVERQLAMLRSSSSPTVFSHSLRPASASSMLSTGMSPNGPTALRVVLLSFLTTVSRAQSASLFQTPQPPTVWRVKPVWP